MKKIINDVVNQPINGPLRAMTASRITEIRSSIQGKEGVTAFLEKRHAIWDEE